MSLHMWSKRWLRISFILLMILITCSLLLFVNLHMDRQNNTSNLSISQVRLTVNPLLLALEQKQQQLTDPATRDQLRSIVQENGVELTYVGLDGVVVVSSTPSLEGTQLNLPSVLHYDLNQAAQVTDGKQSLNIAFPVINGTNGSQIGNAIFTVPLSMVVVEQPLTSAFWVMITLAGVSLMLGTCLIAMKRKVNKRLLFPISQLKEHAESILKGKYDQPIQYSRVDEMGELYAMLDLMRAEIMHLSAERIRQEQAQKELITNISHDLKTPITTVKAYIEAILEGLCSDEQTLMEYMEVMRTHTDKTARLVEDLLVHALQELGQISVEPREVYSLATFQQMLQPIAHMVEMRGLNYEAPASIPNVLMQIDSTRMEQVLSNIVFNALKHTAPGDTIQIMTELDAGQFKLTIADTGQGIQAQDMPFIFERYFKGAASPSNSYVQEGTGLGLSICKSIVEAHGGQITFSSKEGQGTIFQIHLPIC
ncbi:sensor histidine kinase [Paenibacillus tundrae]|uniref:histidine kinase n=1 Tax=Paenibacillus tundrae TaxID=528187 RepID=A0ABT9WKF1_9BACL|nr:HAMP domain-containing sensor histidine kinase [Paenibacillus tundrae]MDQ0173643.1 signal transduction histidine kinase [Paenibacillus tundrae]